MSKNQLIFGLNKNVLLESLLFFLLVLVGDYFLGRGTRFEQISPHPFWIIVLLLSAQYGTAAGVWAAFLSTCFLYIGNVPHQQIEESVFDYQFRLAYQPFLWFGAAFVLGELRMRLQSRLDQAVLEREEAVKQAQAIVNNYEKLKINKEGLESRLAGQINTVAASYESLRSLESLNPVQILKSLDQVITKALSPEKFSVFAAGPNGLEVTTGYGWNDQDPFKRRISPDQPLYSEVIVKKRILVIINKEEEEILDGEGVLAAPLIDQDTGEAFGMLKIEAIDFFRLEIGNLVVFKTICELIGSAYSRSQRYKKALSNAIYTDERELLSFAAYLLQRSYLKGLCKKMAIPLTGLTISRKEKLKLQKQVEKQWQMRLVKILEECLPENSPVYAGEKESSERNILLPAQEKAEVESIVRKITSRIEEDPFMSHYPLHYKTEIITGISLQ